MNMHRYTTCVKQLCCATLLLQMGCSPPGGRPVVTSPNMVVQPQAPQAVIWERHDTAYDRAEAVCLDIWQSLGYAVDLHETPELEDGSGIQCVLEGADVGMCAEVGGHAAQLPCAKPGGATCAMCLVNVPYRDK